MAPGDPTPPMGEAEEAMLNALFTQSPVGLHLLDTDLRVVRVNTATSAMRGVSPTTLIGHRFSDAYDIIDAERHAHRPGDGVRANRHERRRFLVRHHLAVRRTHRPGHRQRRRALLLARTRPFPADRVASWELEPEPAAVCAARHHAGEQLAAWGIEGDTVFNTELIVSELVTNAIRHGAPPLALRLINDRTLTCEVRDAGPAAPRLRHARTVDEGGRGLFITSQLAQSWGTRYDAEGKTIWTEQPLPPRPS